LFLCLFLCHCFQAFYPCILGFTFELHHCFHKVFYLPTFCLHHHHLVLWFLFFISIVSCDYALVFIKLRNQGLRVFVFVSICVIVSIKLSSHFGVHVNLQFVSTTMCSHLHLHHAQVVFGCSSPSPLCSGENSLVCVWIMLFVFNNFCYVVCVFMLTLCCLHLLFCSCFASCFTFYCFAIVFCICIAFCWNVLFFMIYSLYFVLYWRTSCSSVLILLKYFLLWCSHFVEALFILLKHFKLWCWCFVLYKVFCYNIFHFGVRASHSIVYAPPPCAL
jgi:hypothetical protein